MKSIIVALMLAVSIPAAAQWSAPQARVYCEAFNGKIFIYVGKCPGTMKFVGIVND